MESLEPDLHIYENLIYMRGYSGEKFDDLVMDFIITGKKVTLDSYIILYMKINYRLKA